MVNQFLNSLINNNTYGALVQSIHIVIMKNYDATNKRLTLHLGTRVVVMLPFPSEHPTSLVEHPCLGIQYLLLVIIHVSVDNVV